MRSYIGGLIGFGVLGLSAVGFAADPKFGVQGGVSVSNFNAPSGITASNITGFAAGILVEVPLNDNVAIQPEALFVQRGADLTGSGATGLSSKINSLDVPVFLKLGIGSKDVRGTLFAGPNLSFAISNSLVASAGGSAGTVSFTPNTFDLGFAGGVGVEVGPLMVNVRYVAGLLNINNGAATWNSRGFLGMVGLKL